jgi:hypothetical protein
MKKALLLVLLTLSLAMTPLTTLNTQAQSSPPPTLEFNVPPYGTYLRADDKADYGPDGGRAVAPPLIIDLAANGLSGGVPITISFNGTLYGAAYWDGTLGTMIDHTYMEETWLIAVFSTTRDLLPITQLNRVPGAIQTNRTFVTYPTWFSKAATDIPQDFKIEPYSGMDLEIPLNAKYLFICFSDVYYPDNVGAIKVMIDRDSDGDGLLDSWETRGIDINKDGQIDMHLQALGANWKHKDIFVEIDYMVSSGSHSHRPDQGAIDNVIQAFSNAFIQNPDNDNGINLHVFVDESLSHSDAISWWTFDQMKATRFGTAAERTNQNNVDAKKQAFHYCIFAHSQLGTTSGGSGEMPGNDFMITLGDWTGNTGTREEQAAIFMHELGHNLGLRHGGGDDVNYKPNYISVMNYLFTTDDYNTGRTLDYSWGDLDPLNEASLDEFRGIGSSDKTIWVSPNGTLCSSGGYWEIDWNFDGNISRNVAVNINNHVGLNYVSPAGQNLTDYDDWSNLVYRFRGIPNFADWQHPKVPQEEINLEIVQAIREQALSIADPVVIPEFGEWLLLPVLVFLSLIVTLLGRRKQTRNP